MFPICEIMIGDKMPSFSVNKYCQNINAIKVTTYAQLVLSQHKGVVFLTNKIKYKHWFRARGKKKTKRREESIYVIKKNYQRKNECDRKSLLSLSTVLCWTDRDTCARARTHTHTHTHSNYF